MQTRQLGENLDYPKIAEVWRYGIDPIPEWLSDRADIVELDNNGNPVLRIRKFVSGEIEILESGGRDTLVKLKDSNSVLLFSKTHPIISLTKHQFEFLYKNKKE